MLSKKCYGGQTGSLYQEGGLTIDTRPQYPNKVGGNIAANRVVAESMGPGYPDIVRGTPQMESSSRNPVVTSAHDEAAVKTDLVVRQSEKSDQDNRSKIMAPGEISQMSYPQIKDLLLLFLGEKAIVLVDSDMPMGPRLSLQTMLRQ